MEKDKHKTKVQFFINNFDGVNDLFAFFPEEVADIGGNFMSYSTAGEHSSCCSDYVKESRKATKKEYQDLFNELTNIGYNLELI